MSLVARHLEENGLPTLVIGSAYDIVSHCGIPRYLYTDFPLGNPCGKPYDNNMQMEIIYQAISLLEEASEGNTIWRSECTWSEENSWRDEYLHVNESNRAELARLGEARRRQQIQEKSVENKRAPMISQM